jgi:ABC-2 type transport system permease protein
MNRTRVAAIARKEIAAIKRSRAVWMPMVLVPSVLFLLLPLGITIAAHVVSSEEMLKELNEMTAKLPPELRERLALDEPGAAMLQLFLGQLLAPLFVLVPVMTASLVAADGFAGERERRTLEALLHTPITDRELFAGKVLGAFLPALAVCVGGLVVVSIVVDVVAWSLVKRILLPDALWITMALVLAPAISGLAIIIMVIVSSRVRGFQEANQLGALIVLPIVGLLIAQVSGVMFLTPPLVLLIGLGVVAVDVLTMLVAARTFRRETLFLRM